MTSPVRTVAVVDVGKTNAKVVLVDGALGTELALRSAVTTVAQDGPYPHLDAGRLWNFMLDALAELHREAAIDAVTVTAHGSAGAFINGNPAGDGLTLPILDYEHPGPDELAADYDAVRPPFSETFSPRLPAGLNLGAQIFWQERRFPREVAAATAYVNYPQYWAWRLSGVPATEMCSMGAHSDLWDPRALDWSSLVRRLGWQRYMAPRRSAFDQLGSVRPPLAAELGLPPECPVFCGIHDSSASLLPYLKTRQPPFTVVSTGTWVILFAVGGAIDALDPERDTLVNVSAFGDPVPCGRFMGGREFAQLTDGSAVEPSAADLDRILGQAVMALPTFVPDVGPFRHKRGRWTVDSARLAAGERNAAASLYIALVTAESIRAAGGRGTIVIEGPFARNHLFCAALAALGPHPVETSETSTGTTLGAALLATGKIPHRATVTAPVAPLAHPALADYAARWRALAAGNT